MNEVTVREAADTLGVATSRVRALISQGTLGARRVGNTWLVDDDDVQRRARLLDGDGRSRPMTARTFWGLALTLDGEQTNLIADESNRARAVRRLRRRALTEAVVQRWGARRHTAVLRFSLDDTRRQRVLARTDVVRTGISAPDRVAANLDVWGDAEVYATASTVEEMRTELRLLRHVQGNPALTVHMVDSHVIDGQDVAPRLVVACDLADSDDVRTREAGTTAIRAILAQARA